MMKATQQLHDLGQSRCITQRLLTSGTLRRSQGTDGAPCNKEIENL